MANFKKENLTYSNQVHATVFTELITKGTFLF